jgi:uncharacterized protein
VVLHCHGNAGNVESHLVFSEFLAEPFGQREGASVFVFDYRGYWRSDAAQWLTRDKLMADTRAAYRYVCGRADVDAGRVGVLGVSLGGAFALRLAAEEPEIRAVCTLAAFSSFASVAGDHVPILGPMLIGDGLKPATSAGELGPGRPYLIVHGTADGIVRMRHAALLEAAATRGGARVQRVMIEGARHNDIADMPAMGDAVRALFENELGNSADPGK